MNDDEIRVVIKQLSLLVSRMVDPMASALEEIQRSRLSRSVTLAIFGAILVFILSVQTYILLEHQKLFEKIETRLSK